MKTPKPIKRSEHIVSISREHHATLLFCWKLRQGVKMNIDTQRMSQYAFWFWQHYLTPHFDTEERLLFTDATEPMIKKALEEHQTIETLLREVTEKGSTSNLLALADLIDQHTRYEERELFPWIEQNFNEERLISISKILDEEEHDAVEDYADEFWIKQK